MTTVVESIQKQFISQTELSADSYLSYRTSSPDSGGQVKYHVGSNFRGLKFRVM